jgi:hypothetical protein
MKQTKTAYLVGYTKTPDYLAEGESPFGTYITNFRPCEDSESWMICELEVEVDVPPLEFLQAQAVQALQRVRAEELKKGLVKLAEIDSKIATLTAIEHQEAPDAA